MCSKITLPAEEIRFLARPGFVAREIAGDSVLVPIDTGNVFIGEDENNSSELPMFNGMIQLNDIALFIWNFISEPRTNAEILDAIEEEFDTEGFDVSADIEEFLTTGITNQLIFIVSEGLNER